MKTESVIPASIRFWLIAGTLIAVTNLFAQPVQRHLPHLWHPNGTVYSIAVASNVAYLGGNFTYLGPSSGCAGLADLNTATPIRPFPVLQGQVFAIVADGSGGWFLGGQFTVPGTSLMNLVHVAAAGTLDTAWAPNPEGPVYALAASPTTLFAGGDFGVVAKTGRPNLASFSLATLQLDGWNPKVQGAVYAIAVTSADVYVGGALTRVGTTSRSRLASIDPATGAVKSWNPGASGGGATIYAVCATESTVFVGGDFTTCGTKPRNRIAALDAATGVANNWNPNASFSSGTCAIYSLCVAGDKVFAGGTFSAIGGRNRSNLAVLDITTGQASATWDCPPNAAVLSIASAGADLLVAGTFTAINDVAKPGVAALDRDTGAVKDWALYSSSLVPGESITVRSLAVAHGQVCIGGDFVSSGGVARRNLAAVDLASGLPLPWNPEADDRVYTVKVSGNLVYAGGAFNTVDGQLLPKVAAIRMADGTASSWNPQCSTNASHYVQGIAFYQDQVLLGGYFNRMGGQVRNNLAQVSAAAAVLTTFDPAPAGAVVTMLLNGSTLYVGGDFDSIAGAARARLAAVNLTKSIVVTNFNPAPDGLVRTLVMHQDKLYVGGDFSNIGGQARSRLAALDPNTGQETDPWDAGVAITGISGQLRVYSLAPVANTMYVGGSFGAIGGEFKKRLAGISTGMASANGYEPNPDSIVRTLVLTDYGLLAGGDFTTVASEPCPYFCSFFTGPSFVPNSSKIKANGKFEAGVLDGAGHGSAVQVQATGDLSNPDWQTIRTIAVSGYPTAVEDADPATSAGRFYRVVLVP